VASVRKTEKLRVLAYCSIAVVIGNSLPSRIRKRDRVKDVVGLGFGAGAIQVAQHDLPPHASHDERKRSCRTNHAATDDANPDLVTRPNVTPRTCTDPVNVR